MADELTIKEENEIVVIDSHDIGEIMKPLIKEIHLFDSFVAGTTHIQDKTVLEKLKAGDELALLREDNRFDSNAIIIMTGDKRRIGYVPEKDNIIFARLMDAGKLLKARITGIERTGSFTKIGIGIFLVDF